MSVPALHLSGVSKRYGAVDAVHGMDLDVPAGEFLTLLGPSGSGKTTVLTMVAGFETPTRGEIALVGKRVNEVPPHRRGIGVVFQSYALFPHLSVAENVAFALRSRGMASRVIKARVDELLALVGLDRLAERLPAALSGGQQQRVALARALAPSPDLLLLDEPLGALDKALREQMMTEFRRVHRVLGTTMVYVTHDQEEALVMSDRIAVMRDGWLLRVAPPAELYANPGSAFIARMLGTANVLQGLRRSATSAEVASGLSVIVPDGALGSAAAVAVRPERIVLGDVPEGWNRGAGHVEEAIFLGAVRKYRIACGGTTLTVQCANDRSAPLLAPGDGVAFGWHPEDSAVLAPDAGAQEQQQD